MPIAYIQPVDELYCLKVNIYFEREKIAALITTPQFQLEYLEYLRFSYRKK